MSARAVQLAIALLAMMQLQVCAAEQSDGPQLRAVWALSDLPLEVVRLLQNSRDGGIADRDQSFNVSDAVREHCHSED